MQAIKRVYTMVFLISTVLLLPGCNLFPGILVPPEASEPEIQYIIYEDFSSITLGGFPKDENWFRDSNFIQVTADNEIASGKALLIQSEPGKTALRANVTFPFDAPGIDSPKIAIEHKIKGFVGKNDLYVRVPKGDYWLHWSTNDDHDLEVRNQGSGYVELELQLDPNEWHTIRLIADRTAGEMGEYYVYVNDLDEPAGGPYRIRNVPDNWYDGAVEFALNYGAGETKEMLIGDIKVWAVE